MKAPFPLIKVDGFFHPYAPSRLNVDLIGEPTRVRAVVHVHDLVRKKARLTIESRDADLAEALSWFKAGALMGRGPLSEEEVAAQLAKPLPWQISGRANIDAELTSVLGPELIRKADGEIRLSIRDGKLTEMPGLVKALAMIRRAGLLQEGGLLFKDMGGVIDVKDGVVSARHEIILDNPLLNVGLSGHVNFPKQVINARLRLGRVWFVIKGPLDNPAVQRER